MHIQYEIGALKFSVVSSPNGILFLICPHCNHWVRKVMSNTEPKGIVCICECHRPSIAGKESEMNEQWVTPKPNPRSFAA